MGAPLEQAVHMMSAALHAAPETRPFARFLRRRSAGIRDLRQGSLVDEDWRDLDPDALRAKACAEVPLLAGATHCFVAATITRSDKHPIARLLGDALVLAPSASGRSRRRRIGFEEEYGLILGGTHHLALLNHPKVYAQLLTWLR
jgi:pimeloyl-ACP methyl ester carboxylesterase